MTTQPIGYLFKDPRTIRQLFGSVLPHEREDIEYLDETGHPNVKSFVSKGELPGKFVVKEQKFGHGYSGKIDRTKREMMLNHIGKFFFSDMRIEDKGKDEYCKPFIFPDQLAYSGVLHPSSEIAQFLSPEEAATFSEEAVFIIGRHVPSFTDEKLFHDWGPRIRAFTSPLIFGFGLGDNRFDNFPLSTKHTYPLKAAHYKPTPEMEGVNAPAIAVVDTGIVYDDCPLNPTYQSAKKDIATGYMPCINSNGGNNLKAFIDKFEPWIGRLDDKEFLELYYLICRITETDRDEADRYLNEIVKPNFSNSSRNLDIFCAAGNGELPSTVLEQFKWNEEAPVKYNLKDLIPDSAKGLTVKVDNKTRFLLDLNNGHLIFVESAPAYSGKRVKVTDVFSPEVTKLLGSDQQLLIGSTALFGSGKAIAEAHVMLSVSKSDGDLYIFIEDLQRRSNENKLSTQIWNKPPH